jgi:3-phosphoshikimate 1-carboxyvinyltransferase
MRVEPARRLAGSLTPPPDKSISHRAFLLGAMADGQVKIRNALRAEDTASTLSAAVVLGAEVERQEPADAGIDLTLRGVGLRGALEAHSPIDVGNAGTLLRILPGWLAGQAGRTWTLDGDESIRRRPVDRVAAPLRLMGATVHCRESGVPPLSVEGAELRAIRYELPVASAQVKSCVLLAGLLAEGETVVVESARSRDHTERMLVASGAELASGEGVVTVKRAERLEPGEIVVPGDFSSAAFWIAAATLVPDSALRIEEVGLNPTRIGLLRVLERMGGAVTVENRRMAGMEPVAELVVRHAQLRATDVHADEVPLLIDELPLVALLGAFAEGTTTVTGAAELRHKESDRIATVVGGLRALGAKIEARDDGFEVEGRGELRGGALFAARDHRLAMLGSVAGLASREGVDVRGAEAAVISYPGFFDDLARLISR